MSLAPEMLQTLLTAGEGPFIPSSRITWLAEYLHLTQVETMIALLEHDLWPLRFARNRGVLSAQAMVRLLSIKIFIAGCGGLGGAFVDMLVRMGATNIRICDPDTFTESNLNRQQFCTLRTLGNPKVLAVKNGLMEIAPYINVEALQMEATAENLPGLLNGMDVAVDCLDSVPLKKMLENAAQIAEVPYLHGAVLEQEGFIYMDMPAKRRLPELYPGEDSHPPANVLACTVSGAAAVMAALLVNAICGGSCNAGLFHLDFSVPELECFRVDSQ